MERLTLEEAIVHAKEVAEKNYRGADFESIDYIDDDIKTNCIKCAEEHMQLAEWLEELKSYKEAEEQGLLVRLPCPVGTTVWDICGMDIRENVVCGIECGKNGKQFLWANHDEWLGELNDLVFPVKQQKRSWKNFKLDANTRKFISMGENQYG